jgi:hypothetical protein
MIPNASFGGISESISLSMDMGASLHRRREDRSLLLQHDDSRLPCSSPQSLQIDMSCQTVGKADLDAAFQGEGPVVPCAAVITWRRKGYGSHNAGCRLTGISSPDPVDCA